MNLLTSLWRTGFATAAIAVCAACGNGQGERLTSDINELNKEMINGAKPAIQTGDVVLRSGRDFTSYRIRELSDKDKTYSHAGIATVTDSGVFIYHITPPDIDENKADTIMRFETLETFVRPDKNSGFGILRFNLTAAEIARSMHYLDSALVAKISFDNLFDLKTPEKIYCSEMIDNSLSYATNSRIRLSRKDFDEFKARRVAKYLHASVSEVMKRQYIPIDNIHNHPDSKSIFDYSFLK